MVGFYQFLHNGQAHAQAASLAGARFIGAIKTFKNIREVFFGDTLPFIFNAHKEGFLFLAEFQSDGFSLWRVLQRVV